MITEWWPCALVANLHHVSVLRIPQSLRDHLAKSHKAAFREGVAWHQYHLGKLPTFFKAFEAHVRILASKLTPLF